MARTRKPDNSHFKQQRLAAWQPTMTPRHVLSCLFIIVFVFIPIGVTITLQNEDLEDYWVRYDHISQCQYPNTDPGCATVVRFTLPRTFRAPVYLYYGLTRFFQNHRRYVRSRSLEQLIGQNIASPGDVEDCSPFAAPGENTNNQSAVVQYLDSGGTVTSEVSYRDMVYSPCGLVAWSMFNDTLQLYDVDENNDPRTLICDGGGFDRSTNQRIRTEQLFDSSDNEVSVVSVVQPEDADFGNCTKANITWKSDMELFQTPTFGNTIWTANRAAFTQSRESTSDYRTSTSGPFVSRTVLESVPDRLINVSDAYLQNGWYANEQRHQLPIASDLDFIVWARTASLSRFRKLYRVIHRDLPMGSYRMHITERFDVSPFGSEKGFYLTTISWYGGRNLFLGYAYLAVGSAAGLLAIVFIVVSWMCGDRSKLAVEELKRRTVSDEQDVV